MATRYGIAAGIFYLLAPLAAYTQEEVKVSGRVVDAAGKPVAGVEVAPLWVSRGDKMIPYLGTIANAEGRFTLSVTFRGRKQRLMAVDKERKTGGLAWLEEKSASKPVEIKLVPLVHVRGRLSFKELEQRPPYVSLMIFSKPARLLSSPSKNGAFSFRLPPDDYQLRISAPSCESLSKALSLKPETLEVDLGTIEVPASIISKHKGKTPPAWHVSDVRGVKKDVKLSDFKGKWVLLEFWGYW